MHRKAVNRACVTWTVVTWTVVITKFVAQTVIICTVTIRTVSHNLLTLTEQTDAEIFKLGWACKNCESRILKWKVLVWFNLKGEFNKQVSSVATVGMFNWTLFHNSNWTKVVWQPKKLGCSTRIMFDDKIDNCQT